MSKKVARILASGDYANQKQAARIQSCNVSYPCNLYKLCKRCSGHHQRQEFKKVHGAISSLPNLKVSYIVGTFDNCTCDLLMKIKHLKESWENTKNYFDRRGCKILGDYFKVEVAKSENIGFKPHINILILTNKSTHIPITKLNKFWKEINVGYDAELYCDEKMVDLKGDDDKSKVINYINKYQRILYDEQSSFVVAQCLLESTLSKSSGIIKDKIKEANKKYEEERFRSKYPNLSVPNFSISYNY